MITLINLPTFVLYLYILFFLSHLPSFASLGASKAGFSSLLVRASASQESQPRQCAHSHRCDCTPNERAIFHEYFYPVYWPLASQTVGWILIIRTLTTPRVLFLPRIKARELARTGGSCGGGRKDEEKNMEGGNGRRRGVETSFGSSFIIVIKPAPVRNTFSHRQLHSSFTLSLFFQESLPSLWKISRLFNTALHTQARKTQSI